MAATSTRERSAALVVAEAGLWLTLAGGVLGLLDVLRRVLAFEWLFNWGLAANPTWLPDWMGKVYSPTLPATLNPENPELQLPALAWQQTTDGTVDAATGLPPVSITPPVQATVAWPGYDGFSSVEMLVWVAPGLIASLAVIAGSWLLLRVVRSARTGEVFTMANAVRLRWLAAVIAVGGLAHNALAGWGPTWILSNSAAADYLDTTTYTMSVAPLFVGLVIAAVAIIWEHGVRLARDADGLV